MKKKLFLILLLLSVLCLGGCKKSASNTMVAYTSVYPTEYILEKLYGSNLAIYSIYPDGTNYKNYNLTKKQIEDYSKGELYVYNGNIQKEKDYAVSFINNNKSLKIIDASKGMDYDSDVSENWLSPSNFLMMASNIKKGLKEYIVAKVETDKIDANYDDLKLSLSQMDADLKATANNAKNRVIVVDSDAFKFLEKYGFTVISLEENQNLTDKMISEVKTLASNKAISYIFLKDDDKPNKTITDIKNSYNLTTVSLNTLGTISVNDRKDNKDYISIMNDNINSIKLEVNN